MTTGGKAYPVVSPPWVFYSSPFVTRGLWLRADICTAQVDCPQCESKKWQPCKSIKLGKQLPGHTSKSPKYERIIGGYVGMTHWQRRKAAKKIPTSGIEIVVRGLGEDGPPGGGYRITLALPPTVEQPHADI